MAQRIPKNMSSAHNTGRNHGATRNSANLSNSCHRVKKPSAEIASSSGPARRPTADSDAKILLPVRLSQSIIGIRTLTSRPRCSNSSFSTRACRHCAYLSLAFASRIIPASRNRATSTSCKTSSRALDRAEFIVERIDDIVAGGWTPAGSFDFGGHGGGACYESMGSATKSLFHRIILRLSKVSSSLGKCLLRTPLICNAPAAWPDVAAVQIRYSRPTSPVGSS